MNEWNDPLVILLLLIGILLCARIFSSYLQRKNCQAAGLIFADQEMEKVTTTLWKDQEFLGILTSGVGPVKVGEEACRITDTIISDYFSRKEAFESEQDFIKRCLLDSHKKVSEHGNTQSGGCSIALVYVKNQHLYWASSGNISIYLNRERLMRLNQRDLYKFRLREKILDGQISEKRVISNTLRNELTSYLGFENLRRFESNQQPVKLRKRDQLFLCNQEFDTLFCQIEKESILNQRKPVAEKAADFQDRLSQAAALNGKLKFLLIEKFRA
ncbi:hypothetical protein IW492_14910 [Enterococcus sp. BWB1-3]|uniref:hypothetical protein n=1 Tax=Enterococcus sp. BWB1-3 TaxID=2787713 RepID=UPI001922AF00|nr:hypothetical protein [Enterococcus sp. BWB1-3]MBL1230519.1 hypothetical protein [Enterococcus sp. BWB1-3]